MPLVGYAFFDMFKPADWYYVRSADVVGLEDRLAVLRRRNTQLERGAATASAAQRQSEATVRPFDPHHLLKIKMPNQLSMQTERYIAQFKIVENTRP